MNKNITIALATAVVLTILGIVHYETTKLVELPEETATTTPAIIGAYNQGIASGRVEIVTSIRKEIVTTGQLNVDIPLQDGTVKRLILIIQDNGTSTQPTK